MSDYIISKPLESSSGSQYTNYIDFISEIIGQYNGFHAEFAVGVSFGADLEKWSNILYEIFNKSRNSKYKNYKYNFVKKFNYALLITDSVVVESTNEKLRDRQADNLTQWIWNKPAYLHTKFILVKMVCDDNESDIRFVLFVSSKNISNSGNFDLIVPLYSVSADRKDGTKITHGKKIWDYLNFLKDKTDNKDSEVLNDISDLEKYNFCLDFSGEESNLRLTDFEIAYDRDHRFSDLWDSILSANLIISPYMDKDTLESMNNDQCRRIITYMNTYKKLKVEKANMKKAEFYVGKTNEDSGRFGRYKYHTKLYIKNDKGITNIYFGSANMTEEAKNNHCEIMIGIEIDDGKTEGKNSEFDHIKSQLFTEGNNNTIEQADANDIVELEDSDDEDLSGNNYRNKIFALKKIDDKYQWCMLSGNEKKIEQIGESLKEKELSHFIEVDERFIYVCEDNYCKDDYFHKEGYLAYDKFREIVKKNSLKDVEKYHNEFFLKKPGKSGKSGNSGGRNKGKGGGMLIPKYPCMYRVLKEEGLNSKEAIEEKLRSYLDDYLDDKSDNWVVKIIKEYCSSGEFE